MGNLSNLRNLYLSFNQLNMVIRNLPSQVHLYCDGIYLPDRYRRKIGDWQPDWLLNEENAEMRRVLIQQLGYEKICDRLGATAIDRWREYTLLRIDNFQPCYEGYKEIAREPMMLLKMICPSTEHIHILRVPPDLTSAEAAITWVNHGIHPDKFSIQT
jgi:leucine-rich repeat protein SHOC2